MRALSAHRSPSEPITTSAILLFLTRLLAARRAGLFQEQEGTIQVSEIYSRCNFQRGAGPAGDVEEGERCGLFQLWCATSQSAKLEEAVGVRCASRRMERDICISGRIQAKNESASHESRVTTHQGMEPPWQFHTSLPPVVSARLDNYSTPLQDCPVLAVCAHVSPP
jgi:hypothetical protein